MDEAEYASLRRVVYREQDLLVQSLVKGKTNAERQAALKARRKSEGLVTVTGYVPKTARAEVLVLLKRLIEDPDLEIGVRSKTTGRFERL